jgi:hypothetical protein
MAENEERKRMEYFTVDDIIAHLETKFPELTKGSIQRIAKGALRELGKRAEMGKPVSINGRMMARQKGLDFYAVYMPADEQVKFGKIYKYDGGSKRKK